MEAGQSPELAILFVGVCLVLGVACRHLFKLLPYTVTLFLVGIALGASEYGSRGVLGAFGQSIRLWSNINPNLILFMFLPTLLFESSFAMEVPQIKKCLVQIVLLAGPGVVISTFCIGLLIRYTFPYQWTWSICLLLGGLLSATDPVAVVALLKELGGSKKLNTLIEGESIMNDGVAIVIFRVFLKLVFGRTFTAATVVVYLFRVSLGGIGLGLAFGLVLVLWLRFVYQDMFIEIAVTLAASYLAYYTAEDEAHVSGILAVMALGIFFAVFARAACKGESHQLHYFWGMMAYIANTVVFILSGVIIAVFILRNHTHIQGRDWGYLVLLYVFLQLARVIVVVTLLPGLKYFGNGLTWKEAVFLTWAGLRGVVALSLALSVSAMDASDLQGVSIISEETRAKILEYTKHEMSKKAVVVFDNLGEDEQLGPANWNTVARYMSCLTTEDHPGHLHELQPLVSEIHKSQLQDSRLRLLKGVQAEYWAMLEKRQVTHTVAIILMQSVDEALDAAIKHRVLADWKGLIPHVRLPSYLGHSWLRNSRFVPKRVLNFLVIERLQFGCYIAAAFLQAHRSARHQLQVFIGESKAVQLILRESEAEESAAKAFLEDVRLNFPEVLQVLKTKQVTHAILTHLSDYVQGLEKVGLLEEKEMNHLHNIIQTDMQRLLKNPPLVKIPSSRTTLRGHPFFCSQPIEIQEAWMNSARECVKPRNSLLYEEELRADRIYLVTNGVLKWSSAATSQKCNLSSTFAENSTLGLYEVLAGKPYFCDTRADSVVRCFVIEATRVLSALSARPDIEECYWKESALAVAEILLPDQFQGIALQVSRGLVKERCTMRIHYRGETIAVLPGQVVLLLEGLLKQNGTEEINVAPCALTVWNGEAVQGGPDMLPLQDVLYHVETRSRVVVLDASINHPQLKRAST